MVNLGTFCLARLLSEHIQADDTSPALQTSAVNFGTQEVVFATHAGVNSVLCRKTYLGGHPRTITKLVSE